MAKDAKPAEEGAEAPKKSKKLLIIILAVVLLVVLGGGGAAYMLLKKGEPEEGDEEVAEETAKPKKKDKKKDAHAAPVFVNLDPFTVNLVPETGDQYLQVALSLELEDALEEPTLKAQMPKIRNNLTLLLSSKKASELLPKEGKEQLAEALRDEINSVIEPPKKNKKGEVVAPEGPVKSVLFTSFIIQ
ncbi:flagellar basal body-associated FliL family protein [Ferribacterium limneticum]|uniref:flagellar basal body-associated FliL family protein n=1 Tax=Ferribacterium limneticum TaxID=76259 RepID=UPI001CFA14DA|nr:flagellar basal body-associated FliL family protein [Ferribacterium limneticum]UCV27658.1 flagellar basal body-associated FliL family protein [Ferribacterium limneticum]UCV31575.1 flagellar basal body-associated FliL family protein [Ferribacterium limneticum]